MAITKETEIKSAARCCCLRGLNVNQRKDKNNVHYEHIIISKGEWKEKSANIEVGMWIFTVNTMFWKEF